MDEASRAYRREQVRRWRVANPERYAATRKAWQAANRDKVNAQSAAWRAANPEKTREIARKHYYANRDKELERFRRYHAEHPEIGAAWYERNKERLTERNRAWQAANRAIDAEYKRRRRSRMGDAVIPRQLLEAKMSYWGNKCWMCGGPFEHVDHVKPLAKGGAHVLANLRPSCASCNVKKNARWPL